MTFHQVRLHHKPLLGALLLTAMLAACGENDDLQAGQPATGAGKHYVSLTFTMPTQDEFSRAAGNPTGGERGDGYEQGQDNENTIADAVAFFFQNNGAGVNGDASTPVRYMYFDDFQEYTKGDGNGKDRVYKTKPIPTDLYGEYNVLVVANPGKDDWWTSTTTLTLGTVRDKVLTQAWAKEGEEYSYFLMSSAKDAVIEIPEANNTEATAANTTVDVERMAARVDYKKLGSYTCADPNYADATVEIEGAVLVNNLTQPGSYAMKRVSATTSGTINYLGDETLGAGGLPDNWVLDPTTNNKATATFGVSWQDENASNPNWWSGKDTTGKLITKNNEQWNILGYTLENITAPNETKHGYNTAVVFKAKFHPATGSVTNYKDGATFFELGNKLYASMEDLMAAFSGRTVSDMNTALEKCASWDDVETFCNSLRDDDPCGYKLWLKEQIEAKNPGSNEEKESLTWTSYMKNVCGYSSTFTNDVYNVTIDDGVESTAAILAKYGTRTYEEATCYYTWWIRHANDDKEETNGVMEYAIVRNNIYELDVTAIHSLGGYIPNEEEHGFIVTVYVKDWTLLEGETIQM